MNKCFECMQGIEKNIQSGNYKKEKAPMKYWYDFFLAEEKLLKKELAGLKPRKILEIGAGSGRIVKILLENSDAEVYSIEKDREMHLLAKERFIGNNRIKIENSDIIPALHFNLCVCMMNTIGTQAEEMRVLKGALEAADTVLFTVYKKRTDTIRKGIYEKKGHSDFTTENGAFHFNDSWVKGLTSKSYSKKDIMSMVKQLHCKARIIDLCKIAFAVELKK